MTIVRNVELATSNNEGEIRAIAHLVGILRRTASSKCVENKGIVDREIWTLINEKKHKNSPFGIRLQKRSEELRATHTTRHTKARLASARKENPIHQNPAISRMLKQKQPIDV